MSKTRHFFPGSLVPAMLLLFSLPSVAAELYDLTQCAVYHRMIASELANRKQLDIVADAEKEKMFALMALAKAAAREEYGDELAEQMFQEEWAYHINAMMKAIDKNYDNIYRLKYRYRERCIKVLSASDGPTNP
jgi:hypothetical protein